MCRLASLQQTVSNCNFHCAGLLTTEDMTNNMTDNLASDSFRLEMGVFVFEYEYPTHTDADNEGPAL